MDTEEKNAAEPPGEPETAESISPAEAGPSPSPPAPVPTPGPVAARRGICVVFEVIAVLVALYFVCAFLYVAFSRLDYPFEIEWMEGGMAVSRA